MKATLLGKTFELSLQEVYDGDLRKPQNVPAEKRDNTLRIVGRAKRQVLELASSNDWKYFVTVTCDPRKCDRTIHAVQDGFRCFARFVNRKVQRPGSVSYLGVPEPHPNGWGYHAHALASCPEAVLEPYKPSEYRTLPFAIKRAYERAKAAGRKIYHCPWMDKHLGWNLWEPVESKEKIQSYITKYIDKTLADAAKTASACAAADAAGSTQDEAVLAKKRADLYFHSRVLNHAPQKVLDLSVNSYELVDVLEDLHSEILYGNPLDPTCKCKRKAWVGVRVYDGEIQGKTYRVDEKNVTKEEWNLILKLSGFDLT